jgi:alpha-ribazole phosphatase
MANEKHLYCGLTDLPLSEHGGAVVLKNKLQGVYPKKADLYFTSGLVRTDQTLNIIYDSPHREVVSQLVEYDFGIFEMKGHEELKSRDDYNAWTIDKTGNVYCPSGESRKSFTKRVLEGFNLVREQAQEVETALVVCHGGVITCIMDYLFPRIRNFYEWQPEPARGYMLMYDANGYCKYRAIGKKP